MPQSPTDFVSKLNPQRRWQQYSLRSLFVFVTLVSVFFAWVGARYRGGRQTAAVIRELGGSASTWTHWDHRWGKVTAANFSGTDISDQQLARICDLGTLRVLNLERTNVTDDGIRQLHKLRTLRALFVSDTGISDGGLRSLSQLPNLTFLQAHRTKVTDTGVSKLKRGLPDLEVYYKEP